MAASCPNKSGVLYKELLSQNNGNEDIATYVHGVVTSLQDKGLISLTRYKKGDGDFVYHINKIKTENSLGTEPKSTKGVREIDLAKKKELDDYIKDNRIDFLSTKISNSGDAIWVNLTPIILKNYPEQDIEDKPIELTEYEKSYNALLAQELSSDKEFNGFRESLKKITKDGTQLNLFDNYFKGNLKDYKNYLKYGKPFLNKEEIYTLKTLPSKKLEEVYKLIPNKNIINKIKNLNLKIKTTPFNEKLEYSGVYNYINHEIILNGGFWNTEVLAHELIHAATVLELDRNKDFAEKINNFRGTLYNVYKNHLKESEKFEYAFSNNQEFLAHAFSNKEFIDFLKMVKVENKKSFYEKFKELIFEVFNIPTTAFDELNKIIDLHLNPELFSKEINQEDKEFRKVLKENFLYLEDWEVEVLSHRKSQIKTTNCK